ncbi:ATPase H(+)-transporting accessory protein 2 [Ostrinia nubilalis]|uniref:renin receptor n=1 Tax=Ostrinia furnacalis TaxID=93504 RepID=UPI001039F606|nr:renin receptor [Ostrinia furnacalis]
MTVDHLFSNKMAVTMALFWITLVLSVIGSNASGELAVLHSPKSLKFSGSSKTLESGLKEVFSASLGLSVEENSDWDGLSIVDPFNTPEAAVEVYIDGVSSLGNDAGLKSKVYPLTVDEYEPDTFEAVKHRINQRFTNGGNKLVKIDLSDTDQLTSRADIFGEITPPKVTKVSLQHLKYSVEEDYQFLTELEALKTIANQVRSLSPDNIVDFYNFRFRSLHALSDYHGPNSLQAKEAKKLLGDVLEDLSNAFVKAYDGSVLVTAVTTDVIHSRRVTRSVSNEGKLKDTQSFSSDKYTSDYSAIFNIILWFGVVFSFTLIAIVYAIMDMDPGRDSIIYRMTSTRMKKDN